MRMTSEEPPQTMTDSARAKLQGVWTSIRSIKVDGEDVETKMSMLAKWTPRSASDDDNEGGGALENVVRTMFGSCTAFGEDDESSASVVESERRRERSRPSRRREGSSASARARQAVDNLREKAEQRETSPSDRNKRSVSRPFPVSSPNRKSGKQEIPYLVHEVGPPPPPPNVPDLGAGAATFDDGISAISAHTLEELDRENSLKKPYRFSAVRSDLTQEAAFEAPIKNTVTGESTLSPPTVLTEGEERDSVGESMNAVDFTRGRSNTTWESKGSRRTMSTESTDFENVWRQEEQKYWEETVEKDERKTTLRKVSVRHLNMEMNARDMRVRSRSREQDMLSLKQDGTNTTAGSSAFSGMSSPQHSHPHDTMPLDPSDFVPVSSRSSRRMARDPDRIQELISVDAHTEIGEI